jgi:predicted nucleotidyltransferase
MTRDEIIARLKDMEPALRARGITRLQMFGSRARGDNREDSDLDLLVDVDPDRKLSLFELAGVRLDLSDALGVETYLIEIEGLEPRFAGRIEPDLLPVFP